MLRSKLVKIGIAFAAVFVSFIFALILRHGIVPQTARFKFEKNNSISLITEPSDGIAPVIRLIQGAASSVDLVIYELDDAAVETALINAKRHGIAVRVLLSTGYENASSKVNSGAYTLLQSNGVAVRWTPAYFALTHEKSISIDRRESLIMSFNLVSKYYAADRDFGILDRDARDVSAIEATFDADWQGDAHAQAASGDDLVWSPGSRDQAMTSYGALVRVTRSKKSSITQKHRFSFTTRKWPTSPSRVHSRVPPAVALA